MGKVSRLVSSVLLLGFCPLARAQEKAEAKRSYADRATFAALGELKQESVMRRLEGTPLPDTLRDMPKLLRARGGETRLVPADPQRSDAPATEIRKQGIDLKGESVDVLLRMPSDDKAYFRVNRYGEGSNEVEEAGSWDGAQGRGKVTRRKSRRSSGRTIDQSDEGYEVEADLVLPSGAVEPRGSWVVKSDKRVTQFGRGVGERGTATDDPSLLVLWRWAETANGRHREHVSITQDDFDLLRDANQRATLSPKPETP